MLGHLTVTYVSGINFSLALISCNLQWNLVTFTQYLMEMMFECNGCCQLHCNNERCWQYIEYDYESVEFLKEQNKAGGYSLTN